MYVAGEWVGADENTGLGPLVQETEAVRVDEWVREAVTGGARLVTGGERDGARYAPTILADVDPAMRVSCEELFGPAIAVTPVDDIDTAVSMLIGSFYAHYLTGEKIPRGWPRRIVQTVWEGIAKSPQASKRK